MPVVKKLMDNLVKQYGAAKGKEVYYAMEAEGSGPFKKGAKHHDLHEAFVAKNSLPGPNQGAKKKAAAPAKGRRPSSPRSVKRKPTPRR